MSWAARMFPGPGLSDLGLSGIGVLSCLGSESGFGPQAWPGRGARSRTAVGHRTAVGLGTAAGFGTAAGLGTAAGFGAAAPGGRQDARAAVAAVLAGVLQAGAARAVHDTPFITLSS